MKTSNTFLYHDITQTKVYISSFQHLTAEKKIITVVAQKEKRNQRSSIFLSRTAYLGNVFADPEV